MNTLFKIQPIDESRRFLTNNFKPGDSLSIVYIIWYHILLFLTLDYTHVRTMRAACCAPAIFRTVLSFISLNTRININVTVFSNKNFDVVGGCI